MPHPAPPVVLTLSGNDPTGGAGICADIEALASVGCRCAPVVTAVTVQNSERVIDYRATGAALLAEQARAVLEDMPVSAIKIGMIGSTENAEAIHTLLGDYPDLPVVLDPVLAGGGGGTLADGDLVEAITTLLLPQVTVLTPNAEEARRLARGADGLDTCGQALLEAGCRFVLITGADRPTEEVENRFYGEHRLLESFRWPRLPQRYHGSGCTLAAALAGLLAQGVDPLAAAHEAQEFTWEALRAGHRVGMGQWLPNRLFWAREEETLH